MEVQAFLPLHHYSPFHLNCRNSIMSIQNQLEFLTELEQTSCIWLRGKQVSLQLTPTNEDNLFMHVGRPSQNVHTVCVPNSCTTSRGLHCLSSKLTLHDISAYGLHQSMHKDTKPIAKYGIYTKNCYGATRLITSNLSDESTVDLQSINCWTIS